MSRSVAVGKGRIIMLNDIKEENVLFTFFVVTLMIMIYLIFYNFNILDYGYLLCLMDLERKIIELDAEVSADNNFDDIFIKTQGDSFYLQVKNYQNVTFDKIKNWNHAKSFELLTSINF